MIANFLKEFNNLFTKSVIDLLIYVLPLLTLIFSIYSYRKNIKISKSEKKKKKKTFELVNDILTNFYSPLLKCLNDNSPIFKNKTITEFYIYKAYLIENSIYALLQEIYYLETTKRSNLPSFSEDKLKKTKSFLNKLVLDRYNIYKKFYTNEILYISSKSVIRYKSRIIVSLFDFISLFSFSLIIISILSAIYIIISSTQENINIISFILYPILFLSYLWFFGLRASVVPKLKYNYKESTLLSGLKLYFSDSLAPYDGEYKCSICNKNFKTYRGLILTCPSNKAKCSLINIFKLIKKI